jgi:hypothetical protein
MNTKTLDQIKSQYYGEVGIPERDRLKNKLTALRIRLKISMKFRIKNKL